MDRSQLSELKRPDLQKLCKEHSLKASGKNSELVDRLCEHFEQLQVNTPSAVEETGQEIVPEAVEETAKETEQQTAKETTLVQQLSEQKKLESAQKPQSENGSRRSSVVKSDRPTSRRSSAVKPAILKGAIPKPPSKVLPKPKSASVVPAVKPSVTKTRVVKSAPEKVSIEKPALEKTSSDKAAVEKTVAVKKSTVKAVSKPAISKTVEKHADEKPIAEKQDHPQRKKFDLKASLQKPITWKAYSGPIKPLEVAARPA